MTAIRFFDAVQDPRDVLLAQTGNSERKYQKITDREPTGSKVLLIALSTL